MVTAVMSERSAVSLTPIAAHATQKLGSSRAAVLCFVPSLRPLHPCHGLHFIKLTVATGGMWLLVAGGAKHGKVVMVLGTFRYE